MLKNQTLNEDEIRIGEFRKHIELQAKDAVFELNKKYYPIT